MWHTPRAQFGPRTGRGKCMHERSREQHTQLCKSKSKSKSLHKSIVAHTKVAHIWYGYYRDTVRWTCMATTGRCLFVVVVDGLLAVATSRGLIFQRVALWDRYLRAALFLALSLCIPPPPAAAAPALGSAGGNACPARGLRACSHAWAPCMDTALWIHVQTNGITHLASRPCGWLEFASRSRTS